MALLESDLQRALFMWAAINPELKWLYACPNGGKRNSFEASNMKAQGVKAGILDIALDVARGGYHGFKLELKIPGGKCKKPSKEQEEYIEFCKEQGYFCFVSNNFEQCKAVILDYLNGKLIRGTDS
jgi:hypothetical protein